MNEMARIEVELSLKTCYWLETGNSPLICGVSITFFVD